MLVRIANREDPDLKQSDLGLHYLLQPFWEANSVSNFRPSTVQMTLFNSTMHNSILLLISTRQHSPGIFFLYIIAIPQRLSGQQLSQ